mgnify:CR=1 FL=1
MENTGVGMNENNVSKAGLSKNDILAMERQRQMSIISFQPHTLFEQSQFHKKGANIDESHGSIQGNQNTHANKELSNEGHNQELSGGAKDFSNQEEGSNQEQDGRNSNSEQNSIKVDQQ